MLRITSTDLMSVFTIKQIAYSVGQLRFPASFLAAELYETLSYGHGKAV
jgi:hypothetical protein